MWPTVMLSSLFNGNDMQNLKKITLWFLILFGLLEIVAVRPCTAQNILTADPADIFDSKSIFINSAVIPFQKRQVGLGMQVHQLGFVDNNELGFNTGYFSLSLAEAFPVPLDFGLSGQNFSTPLYDQTNFSVHFATKPMERLSFGLKYNVFTKSYHQRYFDLVDVNDPVFANGTLKFAQSVGAGVLVFPWSTLSLGFALDHINRPDISLSEDQFRQPMIYDFGLRYSYGYFSSSVHLNYFQQHWQFNWLLESRPTPISTFRAGFVQQSANIQAQLEIFDGFAINYAFDYPLYEMSQISSGSHQINFIYELGRKNPLDEFYYTSYNDGKVPLFDLPSQFFVEMNAENLEIVARKVVREIEDQVPNHAIANLTEIELALNDTIFDPAGFYEHGQVELPLSRLPGASKYSTKYDKYLDELADNFSGDRIELVKILTESASRNRGEYLFDKMNLAGQNLDRSATIVQSEGFEPTQKVNSKELPRKSRNSVVQLNPDKAVFYISSLKMGNYRRGWRLVIFDYFERDIKTISEPGNVPEKIEWDWQNNKGKLIQPDTYFYRFIWFDKNNKEHHTRTKSFTVQKRSQSIFIDVCMSPKINEPESDRVEIKLTQ